MLCRSDLERHEERVEGLATEQQELKWALEPCLLGVDSSMLARGGRTFYKAVNTAVEGELSFRACVALARR